MKILNYNRNKRNPKDGITVLTHRREDINANNSNKEKSEVLNIYTFGVIKRRKTNHYTELTDVMKS